jgi:dihydrofolate synthase/folylpolyglutamate synthase
MTAAAFRWFADVAVDVMVIEVGCSVGGTPPTSSMRQVAVITNIGMDHTEFAGPTLEHIAREKAGIIKPVPRRWSARPEPELVEIFATRAAPATLVVRDDDFELVGNRSPSAAACSTCARRPRSTPTSTCRCTAPTRATTPRWRSWPSRRSSPRRSPRTS